jgi:hypothetical protein
MDLCPETGVATREGGQLHLQLVQSIVEMDQIKQSSYTATAIWRNTVQLEQNQSCCGDHQT